MVVEVLAHAGERVHDGDAVRLQEISQLSPRSSTRSTPPRGGAARDDLLNLSRSGDQGRRRSAALATSVLLVADHEPLARRASSFSSRCPRTRRAPALVPRRPRSGIP